MSNLPHEEDRTAPTFRAAIWLRPTDVRQRLSALHRDLTPERLAAAVRYGIAHRRDTTLNDPPTGPGLIGWIKANRGVRDLLVPLGWERDNRRNLPRTVAPEGQVAIIATAGNSNTGIPERTPLTNSSKGPATIDIIHDNQSTMWAFIREPHGTQDRVPTWLLMYHLDERLDEWRAELSLPIHLSDDMHVNGWRERIILPVDSTGEIRNDLADEPDDDNDIDIVIERLVG